MQWRAELERQTAHLSRGDLARQSLEQFGALILARDADEACALADEIAPEHLHIAADERRSALGKNSACRRRVSRALQPGCRRRLCGRPVARAADRRHGAICQRPVGQRFLRGNSVIALNEDGLAAMADDIRRLADKEGLTAHRASVDVRFQHRLQAAPELVILTRLSTDLLMSYYPPRNSGDAGLRARRAAAAKAVHQAQHERESVSVVAGGAAGNWPGDSSGLAKVSRPDGDCVSPAAPRSCWASSRIGFCAATAATNSDDRHAGVRRPRRAAAAAVSQLHPLPDAGPAAGSRRRRKFISNRLVARRRVRQAASRD